MSEKVQFTSSNTSAGNIQHTSTGTNGGKVHIQTSEIPDSAILKKEATEWAVVKALALYGHLPIATNKERTQIVTVADYIESGTAPQMFNDSHARVCLFALLADHKGERNETVIKANIDRFLLTEFQAGRDTFKKLLSYDLGFIPDTVSKHHADDKMPAYERYVLGVMDYFHWMMQVTAEGYFSRRDAVYPAELQQLQDEFLKSITSNCIFNQSHLSDLYNHVKA